MLRVISTSSSKSGSRPLIKVALFKRVDITHSLATSNKLTRSYVSGTDNFLSTSNANYIDEMYKEWKKDPTSVHVSWNAYFKNMRNTNISAANSFQTPPTLMG